MFVQVKNYIVSKTYLLKTKKFYVYTLILFYLLYFVFCLPNKLFNDPYTSVITDESNRVLSAKIANDNQWRFPEIDTVPEKFKQCILSFEDEYFYQHPGINPVSLFRALFQNVKSSKTISGGSTISMQVIRLSRKNKARTYFEKLIEMNQALRMEFSYSKDEILRMYVSHAPYGGNLVGLEAASWRYYGRSAKELSWAESATLAVLPNAPSLIYPGKNQEKLLVKRNKLLKKLNAQKIIDDETLRLALLETLPQKSFAIPNYANHLLNRSIADFGNGKRITTSINFELNAQVGKIIERQSENLKANQINNAAVLVMEVNTGKIICYQANTKAEKGIDNGNDVDMINAQRSTGSLLKPFLYASMLNEGVILPNTLVPDIPTQMGGFNPQNFSLTYDGAVPAKRALARSLNIPAVKMLQTYGMQKFNDRLLQLGLNTINKGAEHYGLSVVLGGAESRMIDMASAYASMARVLKHYNQSKKYDYANDFFKANYCKEQVELKKTNSTPFIFNASSIYLTFEAMAEVARPDIDLTWRKFASGRKIAWKTGTSFGFRDAWAIGVTPDYVVAVWVGNADGEGRPGLTGISAAAPILFEVFGGLQKKSTWFDKPLMDLKQVKVCVKSGCLLSENCDSSRLEWVPKVNSNTEPCAYHKIVHLDLTGMYRVNSDCEETSKIKNVKWFILPPAWEYFYKTKNPTYQTLPPFKPGCENYSGKLMEMIYPKNNTSVYIPVDLDGKQGSVVFDLAHRLPSNQVFWHLDENFVGTTQQIHQLALSPNKGKHKLTVVDEAGETISINFEVVSDKK